MMVEKGKLTTRQKKFVDLYLLLGNAAEAAVRAGFKRSYAQGAMRQTAVQAYLKERLDTEQSQDVASSDEIMAYLTKVMRGEVEGNIQILENLEAVAAGSAHVSDEVVTEAMRIKAALLLAKRMRIRNEVREELQRLDDYNRRYGSKEEA